jgi:hypothetical protein
LQTIIALNLLHPSTYSGYLADIHFIDGQALDPSSFGEFDTNGVWQPIDASGLTYGTNGFHLPFSDNSTAAALGTDTSSNGNTWTVNNISVTAGVGNDSVVDSPTNGSQVDTGAGGEVVGNYCTLNSLSSALTLVNGNLDFNKGSAADWKVAKSTFFVATGKWYWEVTVAAYSSGGQPIIFGIANDSSPLTGTDVDITAGLNGYFKDGQKRVNSTTSSYGASYTNGDVIGFAFDLDAGTLTAYKNGSSQGTLMSSITGSWTPAIGLYTGSTQLTSDSLSINFGQRPFAYTAPSGFKALCTTNLPEPVVAKPNEVMDVVTYTGDGSSSSRSITGLSFSPDFVWIKNRSSAYSHTLYDQIRGVGPDIALASNTTGAEGSLSDGSTFGYLSAFNSNGFSIVKGSDATSYVNGSGQAYVAWTWDAGSSTVSNTEGSITSQVRANASAGFSIATFTTNSSSGNATIGHGLGVAPKFVIVKSRNATYNWDIYHGGISNAKDGRLIFTTAAFTTSFVPFGGVDPTSTVFTLSQSFYGTGIDCVAYCFAPVAGYSSFGSYTGNGSADGPFVYTGFRPRWIMWKKTNTSTDAPWVIVDTARSSYNLAREYLLANASDAEASVDLIDVLSNGFKWRGTAPGGNASGDSYIYYAVAENPFQYARAR